MYKAQMNEYGRSLISSIPVVFTAEVQLGGLTFDFGHWQTNVRVYCLASGLVGQGRRSFWESVSIFRVNSSCIVL